MSTIKKISLVAGVAMALASGAGYAATVQSQLFGDTLFEDDSATDHIDANTNGLLEVGDRIRGILNIPRLVDNSNPANINFLGGISGNNELSGIYDAVVVLMCAPGGLGEAGCTAPYAGTNTATYAFAPSGALAAEFAGVSANALLALWQDPAAEFAIGGATCTTTGSGGDCEGNITDGSLFLTTGFTGDLDERFIATLPVNPNLVGGLGGTSDAIGQFNYALGVVDNPLLLGIIQRNCSVLLCDPNFDGFDGDGLVDIIGSGQALGRLNQAGGTRVTPYMVTDDTDFSISFIPEPGTVALLGMGLLGAGLANRRRNA